MSGLRSIKSQGVIFYVRMRHSDRRLIFLLPERSKSMSLHQDSLCCEEFTPRKIQGESCWIKKQHKLQLNMMLQSVISTGSICGKESVSFACSEKGCLYIYRSRTSSVIPFFSKFIHEWNSFFSQMFSC